GAHEFDQEDECIRWDTFASAKKASQVVVGYLAVGGHNTVSPELDSRHFRHFDLLCARLRGVHSSMKYEKAAYRFYLLCGELIVTLP
ncbi:MAG: hypothetical protein KAR73_10575, partial [Spirochaetales bacterium]|nr:hypothetical protein [Spirochaetales bacterium]